MSEHSDLTIDQHHALVKLRWLIDEVVRLGEEYETTADIVHPDDVGSEREAAFLKVIQHRFGAFSVLQRATVQQADGTAYGQHDVVVADPQVPPHRTLASNSRVYIAPRGVHAAIEVKSTLGSGKLLDSLNHLARLKSAERCSESNGYRVRLGDRAFPYVPICGGIFAYRSKLKLSSISDQVWEWARHHPSEQWPNFVVVLDRGMVTWCNPADGATRVWPFAGDVPIQYDIGDPCSPLVALIEVVDMLQRAWQTPGTPFRMPPPLHHGTVGLKIGRTAVRPPGVPTPPECDHECANCHHYGRMSFDEQRQHDGAGPSS